MESAENVINFIIHIMSQFLILYKFFVRLRLRMQRIYCNIIIMSDFNSQPCYPVSVAHNGAQTRDLHENIVTRAIIEFQKQFRELPFIIRFNKTHSDQRKEARTACPCLSPRHQSIRTTTMRPHTTPQPNPRHLTRIRHSFTSKIARPTRQTI